MIPQMFLCAVSVCVIAVLVDKLRIYLLEKPIVKLLDKLSIGRKIDAVFSGL